MADRKISELTNITGANLADGDELVVVDASASETKAITFGEFKNALDTATGFVSITGDTMTGDLALSGADITFGDNDKAIFGAGSDLQIYHDGSNSYIIDSGIGDLFIQGYQFIKINNVDGSKTSASFNVSGPVILNHNNNEKLATTSTGIDVTGTVTADGLTVDGTNDVALITTNQSNYTEGLTLRNTANWGYGTSLSFEAITSLGGSNAEVGRITSTWNTTGYHGLDFYTLNNNTLLRHMRLEGDGDFALYEDTGTTAKFFWDASAESLGIGTTSPQAQVHLQGSGSSSGRLRLNNTNTANYSVLEFRGDSQSFDVGLGNSAATATLQNKFYIYDSTNTTTRLVLDSSGQVGIGTTSPSSPLTIAQSADNDLNGLTGIRVDAAGATNNRYLGLGIYDTQGVVLTAGSSDTSSSTISFRTAASGAEAERMRIDSSGNVGIGTSSPASKLEVVSSISGGAPVFSAGGTDHLSAIIGANGGGFSTVTGNYFSIWHQPYADRGTQNNLTERMRIDSSGNVLINGTTDYGSARLYLTQSADNDGIGIVNSGITYTTFLRSNAAGSILSNNGSLPIILETNSTERMRIDGSGNLLVGKTSTNTINTVGHDITDHGEVMHTTNGGTTMYLNRKTSDGTIIDLRKDGTTVGSIGVEGADLTIGNGDVGIGFVPDFDAIRPMNMSTNAIRDAAIDLGRYNDRFKDLYLSGGVYLGGVGAANHLDDYEEGTWTISFLGATITPTNSTGYYTKVGNKVFVHYYSGSSTITGASGSARFDGLPFTVDGGGFKYSPFMTTHNTYFGGSATVGTSGFFNQATTQGNFITTGITSSSTYTNGTGKYIMLSGFYQTAS